MEGVSPTGRLHSNEPNMQEFPVDSEQGRAIRRAFLKSVNFRDMYQQSWAQAAEMLGVTEEDAKAMLQQFNDMFPAAKLAEMGLLDDEAETTSGGDHVAGDAAAQEGQEGEAGIGDSSTV